MASMTNALIKNVANIANDNSATISNIAEGGQLGVGPHIPNIDAATPLVFAPAIPIITHVPTMFSKVKPMAGILKSLVERNAKAITGIDFGYELDEGSGYILADGQEAKVPTKNKRTAISPNMTFPEIQGNLVWNFFRTWMSMISHPDTHHSKLAAMNPVGEAMDPFVYSSFCMDMLFIQFDPTMLPENIIDAIFVTTMYPKTTGIMGIKREVGTTDVQERSIDFNGIVTHNSNTYAAGKAIAKVLGLHKANFDFAKPVASSIEKPASGLGVEKEISEIMQDFQEI